VTSTYGKFTKEADGRMSGHVIYVYAPRRDGKYPTQHHFGSGRRINKLYSKDQLLAEIAKLEPEAL